MKPDRVPFFVFQTIALIVAGMANAKHVFECLLFLLILNVVVWVVWKRGFLLKGPGYWFLCATPLLSHFLVLLP